MEEILASIRRIIADDPVLTARAQNNTIKEDPPGSSNSAQQTGALSDALRREGSHSFPRPEAGSAKALAAAISPPRPPEIQTREEIPPVRTTGPEVQSAEELDADILASDEETEVDPGFDDPDADYEEQDEQPAQQVREMMPSPPAHRAHESHRDPTTRHANRSDNAHRLMSSATTRAVDTAFNTLAETVFVQNGPTLEDLVKQMLRPMLKDWIDDNLPQLVERLVRAEIERVSRGRG
jgi:cell pole-organizing protein PopZ